MKHKSYQLHIQIAVIYFLVAALLGLLLRSYPIFAFDFNYRFVVHAHSHIALLGWVYVALTTLLHYFLWIRMRPVEGTNVYFGVRKPP